MSVAITKQPAGDGTWYEIGDFRTYVDELTSRGIETPKAKYRVFIPAASLRGLASSRDVESQIAAFFRLGPASGIDYQIMERLHAANP